MASTVNNGAFTFANLTGATANGSQFRDAGTVIVGTNAVTTLTDANKHLMIASLRINSAGSGIFLTGVAVIQANADEFQGFSTWTTTASSSGVANATYNFNRCLIQINSSTRFIHSGGTVNTGTLRLTDCVIFGARAAAFFATDSIIKDTIFDSFAEGIGIRATFSSPNAIDGVTIQNAPYAFNCLGAFSPVVRNTTLKNISITDFYVNNASPNVFSGTWQLIDVESSWNFTLVSSTSGQNTGRFRRDYTYSLTLLNESNAPQQNANIRITNLSGTQVFLGATDSSGKIPDQTLRFATYNFNGSTYAPTKETPHLIRRRKYGYNFVDFVLDIQSKYADNTADELNPFITLSEATSSAITGVSIDRATSTITANLAVNPSLTFTQLRHYCHWSDAQQVNLQYPRCFSTTDGVNFTTNYNLVISGGLLSAPSGALISFGARTFSTVSGGSTNAIIQTNAGVQVSLVLTGVVAGSTIRIFSTTGTLITEQVASSSTFTLPYTWTADVVRDIAILRSGYRPLYLRALTLGNRGLTQPVAQQAIRSVIYA